MELTPKPLAKFLTESDALPLGIAGGKRPKFHLSEIPRNRAIVDSDGVWLHTEKDDGFIETLKEIFPWDIRQWHPEHTAWRVNGLNNIEMALGLFKTFFSDGVIIDE